MLDEIWMLKVVLVRSHMEMKNIVIGKWEKGNLCYIVKKCG